MTLNAKHKNLLMMTGMILRTIILIIVFFISVGSNAQETPLNLDGLDTITNDNKDTVTEKVAATGSVPVIVQQQDSVVSSNIPISSDTSLSETPTRKRQNSFWTLIAASGLIGYTIILLSFFAVALMIEYSLTIRSKILMPPGFADEVLQLLSQGQLAASVQKCQADMSPLAQILHAGMKEYEFGWDAIEKAAEETTAEQASRLYRKIEYLNVIGNIAPMLGLLGTVVGMVTAFQQLAESEGYARAADLAGGIYLALVTTVEGLLVAIPCLALYSFFSNRIAALISETTFVAEQVLLPIKKSFTRKK
ncbi:MAG: MotA/TolQ/ExbB proton channel family protein [Planctomycetaceae bacterium]|jgi:biopolymer transport protein ExbB|nr:MotA/TolQ/ExbB proton channel family protein [Planctomycetaceae bacterium]